MAFKCYGRLYTPEMIFATINVISLDHLEQVPDRGDDHVRCGAGGQHGDPHRTEGG